MEKEEDKKKPTYYMAHKEKYSQKIRCEICGGTYNKTNASHHMKTEKHKYMAENLYNRLYK